MIKTNFNAHNLTLIKKNGISVYIKLSPDFEKKQAQLFLAAQKVIDSSVLNYSALYAPKKTGKLIADSFTYTNIGSGKIVYPTKYAGVQYYNTKTFRPYDYKRGALWFERMKLRHKKVILQNAATAIGARHI